MLSFAQPPVSVDYAAAEEKPIAAVAAAAATGSAPIGVGVDMATTATVVQLLSETTNVSVVGGVVGGVLGGGSASCCDITTETETQPVPPNTDVKLVQVDRNSL